MSRPELQEWDRARQEADALRLMKEALAMLDSAGVPSDVGAHLDMAVGRLSETMLQRQKLDVAERERTLASLGRKCGEP